MKTLRNLACFVLAATSLGGCIVNCSGVGPTNGELGRAQFEWSDGLSCLLGCPIQGGVVVGGDTSITVVNRSRLPTYTVRSSNPAVFQFAADPQNRVDVRALAEGTAALELVAASDGSLVDRITLSARPAARIDPTFDDDQTAVPASNLALDSSRLPIFFRYADGTGNRLRGTNAFTASASGQVTVASTGSAGYLILFGPAPEIVTLQMGAAGPGTLLLTSGAASASIDFTVVDATAVAAIDLVAGGDPTQMRPGDVLSVTARGQSATAEAIQGMRCDAWTIVPAGVISGPSGTNAVQTVYADAAGQADLTCTLGAASDTIRFVVR